MNRHLAKFLTRLYPPDWRARYGAEFQTFLESRSVPAKEVLNVIGRAAIEHVLEDLRYAPILIAFALAAAGGVYLATGHGLREALSHYPALSCAWLALEAASLGLLVYALSVSVHVILGGTWEWMLHGPRRWVPWTVLLTIAALEVLQPLPWRLNSRPWVVTIAIFNWLAATAIMAGIHALARRLVSEVWKWGARRLELLRLSATVLLITIYSMQFGRAFDVLSHGEGWWFFWFMSWYVFADDAKPSGFGAFGNRPGHTE